MNWFYARLSISWQQTETASVSHYHRPCGTVKTHLPPELPAALIRYVKSEFCIIMWQAPLHASVWNKLLLLYGWAGWRSFVCCAASVQRVKPESTSVGIDWDCHCTNKVISMETVQERKPWKTMKSYWSTVECNQCKIQSAYIKQYYMPPFPLHLSPFQHAHIQLAYMQIKQLCWLQDPEIHQDSMTTITQIKPGWGNDCEGLSVQAESSDKLRWDSFHPVCFRCQWARIHFPWKEYTRGYWVSLKDMKHDCIQE